MNNVTSDFELEQTTLNLIAVCQNLRDWSDEVSAKLEERLKSFREALAAIEEAQAKLKEAKAKEIEETSKNILCETKTGLDNLIESVTTVLGGKRFEPKPLKKA